MKICCVNHVKTKTLQRLLGLRHYEAVGLLEMLFNFAAQNADDGHVGKYTNNQIAIWIDWFGDADDLVHALVESGYLEEIDRDARLAVHDWNEHAPTYIKKRLDKRRQRAQKTETRDSVSPDVAACLQMSPDDDINHAMPSQAKENTIGDRDIDLLVEKWNKVAQVAKCRSLSPRRQKAVARNLDEDDRWIDNAMNALDKFPLPCWTDGSFTPNFDWFIKPDTVTRILEGQYNWGDNAKSQPIPPKTKTPEQIQAKKQYRLLHAELKEFQRRGEGLTETADNIRESLNELEAKL